VAEELLNRAHRLAGRGEPGRERVAQVVEAHHEHAGVRACGLEAAAERRAVERPTGPRIGEDTGCRRVLSPRMLELRGSVSALKLRRLETLSVAKCTGTDRKVPGLRRRQVQ
jgi:hypothetical protein